MPFPSSNESKGEQAMCGRFNLRVTPAQLQEFFDLFREPEVTPRYNIAPTQTTLVCRLDETGERELAPLRWGLIPNQGDCV